MYDAMNCPPDTTSQPRAPGQPSKLVLLGIPFHDVTFEETVAWARARIASRVPAYLATANLDFVMQAWVDPELQRILIEANLVVADGMPLVRLSPWFGPRLRERVTGSDLVPLLAGMCRDAGYSLFLLGGAPGVAEKAAAALTARFPGLRMAGCYAPPRADVVNMNHAEILARLEAARPDLLLVAFGAPKQEKWVNMHVWRWGVPLAIGVGGSLDFLAGVQWRAPVWVRRIGLEWVWRLGTNPRRLYRRYAGNIVFLLTVCTRLLALRLRAGCGSRPKADAVPMTAWTEGLDAHVRLIDWPGFSEARAAQAWSDQAGGGMGHPLLVLDLHAAHWLSSLELGTLLTLAQSCRVRNARLFLIRVAPRVRQLLTLCRLDHYLDLAATPGELRQTIEALEAAAHGRVETTADGLEFRLPAEMTAVNLPEVRACWDEAWRGQSHAGPGRSVLVNAQGTHFMDSAALGFLVGLKSAIEQAGWQWHCTEVQPAVRQVFRLTHLERMLLPTS